MKVKKLFSKMPRCGREGFSLIELMVVVGILGILAVAVGGYINATPTKLKSFVFNTKMRFNQARFEAVKRSRDVYLDFDFSTPPNFLVYAPDTIIDNGFTLWVDDHDDGNYVAWVTPAFDINGDGDCDLGEGDCNGDGIRDLGEGDYILETVTFVNKVSGGTKHGPEIYAGPASASGGPADPDGGPGTTSDIEDGVTAGLKRFQFRPDGDSKGATAYFYFPTGPDGAKEVASGPWAIIVNTVGRIRVDEWSPSGGWEVNE